MYYVYHLNRYKNDIYNKIIDICVCACACLFLYTHAYQ